MHGICQNNVSQTSFAVSNFHSPERSTIHSGNRWTAPSKVANHDWVGRGVFFMATSGGPGKKKKDLS
jgi:hypothetical protein